MSGDGSPWWLRWDGRNGRQQWWIVGVLTYVVGGIIGWISQESDSTLLAIIAGIVSIAILYLYLAANARRFHDRGKSGWWSLIGLIPIIGNIWILIECGFLKGDPGPNRYGNPV